MAFANVTDFVQAELDGKTFFSCWRKQPTQTTGAGIWFDLSMSPGNPVPNYYAASPNIAIALAQSTDGGIPHGGVATGKYVKQFGAMTVTAAAAPLPLMLCDYLMFYPFVDMSVTDPQAMTTSIALPRYPTGAGVQVMPVVVASPSGAGNPQFFIQYTNQDGTAGKISRTMKTNTQTVNGTIACSALATNGTVGPFVTLADGDTGVRLIESVTFMSPDIGLLAFVLVKPLMSHSIRAVDAPVERDCFQNFSQMPEIVGDAYLNLIALPNGSLSGANLIGYIRTVWS